MNQTKKIKILYAEDEFTNRKIMELYLKRLKVDVTIATDGILALKAIEEQAFDAVFLDLYMPGKNGVEVAQAVRLMYPQMPLVAVTSDDTEAARFSEHGFGYSLIKPFQENDVRFVVESIQREMQNQ